MLSNVFFFFVVRFLFLTCAKVPFIRSERYNTFVVKVDVNDFCSTITICQR